MLKKIQAKQICDERIYLLIEESKKQRGMSVATVSGICELLPEFPRKVVLAKLRNMVESKKINGCAGGFSKIVKV